MKKIVIDNNITTAFVNGADGKVYTGVAKCNATDKFDASVGVDIATHRANLNRADGEITMYCNKIKEISKLITTLESEADGYKNKIEKLNLEKQNRIIELDYLG